MELMCYASRKGRGCSEEHKPHATWKRSAKDLDWQGCNQRTCFLNLTTLPGETQRQYIVNSTPAYSREIQSETNSYNAFTSLLASLLANRTRRCDIPTRIFGLLRRTRAAMTISMHRNKRDSTFAGDKRVTIPISISTCTCGTPPYETSPPSPAFPVLLALFAQSFYEHCPQITSFPNHGTNPSCTMREEPKHGIFIRWTCVHGP